MLGVFRHEALGTGDSGLELKSFLAKPSITVRRKMPTSIQGLKP